ncbi:MAG: Kelch repeat-containing protein [Planctomycetota bacterium]
MQSPTEASVLAYDPARQRTVMYQVWNGFPSETWEWDGVRWQPTAVGGPAGTSPGIGADPMAWESTSGHMFMISNSQLWEYDGAAWTQKPQAQPFGSRLVSAGGILYRTEQAPGGGCFSFRPEHVVSQWDPALQTFVRTAGTCADVVGHAGLFVDYGGQLAFVGWTNTALGQVYLVAHGATNPPWTPIGAPLGLNPNGVAMLAYDSSAGHLHLYATYQPQHYRFDGVGWSPVSPGSLPPGDPGFGVPYHLAYDAARARMVLFLPTTNETWEFDGAAWSRRDVGLAKDISFASMTHDALHNETVLFGSVSSGDETFLWRGDRWRRAEPSTRPPGRAAPLMVFDRSRNTVLLHGGSSTTSQRNDTWEWNGTDWTDRSPPPALRPPLRIAGTTSMAFHDSTSTAILFSGTNPSTATALGDTWEWNGTNGTWTQRFPAGPTPGARFGHVMTYDVANSRILLFGGGSSATPFLIDTWGWDGTTWTQLSATGPGNTFRQLGYDRDRGIAILFTNNGTGPVATWEFDGITWQPVAATNEPGGGACRVGLPTYEDSRRQLLTVTAVYGSNGSARLETWIYLPVPPGPYGTGCAGTGGLVPQLSVTGRLDVSLQQALPSSLAILGFGIQRASFPLLGCSLLIDPIFRTDLLFLDGTGAAGTSLPVPFDLAGVVTFQAAVFDAAAPGGLSFSNAVEARF